VIIVIEGPDASGKTTLAKAIAEAIDAAYVHASAPLRHPLVEYTEPIETLRPEHIVLDRWHIGEMIYGPKYRGKAGLSRKQFDAVEEFLSERGALLVHCDDRFDELVSRMHGRGEEIHPTYQQEIRDFRHWVRESRLPAFTYRLSAGEIERQRQQIIGFAKGLGRRCTS
jgi:thymidylate kinase